ncbi:MAG: sugar ABC transporter permease [Chloroflexi bacterium]|uniref:hypothetical protein n=1 Tax=Candidatus Flexifilum breve TaxID=3140694 RepID=UPI0031363B44|nr:sugar ABC transporter permease [Chloroflexota bacterium]
MSSNVIDTRAAAGKSTQQLQSRPEQTLLPPLRSVLVSPSRSGAVSDLVVVPLLYQLYISFFDWRIIPGQTSTYVGFANYEAVFADRTFWLAMRNTAGYAVVTVAGQ